MLGLEYPGGPVIERLAKEGDAGKIKFPIAKISDGRPDFSFSGLKTAVSRYLRENEIQPVVKRRSARRSKSKTSRRAFKRRSSNRSSERRKNRRLNTTENL
jgi:tRNA A37 threonylcarbamoyltransferase TsaD